MKQPATTQAYGSEKPSGGHSLPPQQQRRLMAILEDYLEQIEHGLEPDRAKIVADNPQIGKKLKAYFDSLSLLNEVAGGYGLEPDTTSYGRDDTAKRIGDYTILREVGRGGMGVVYEAKEISLDRRVALKVLPFAAVLDPKQTTRFRYEAQAAAQLHHGHIVPVYSVGCERGVHYYAMQFIDGQSLDNAIDQLRRLDTGRLLDHQENCPDSTGTRDARGVCHSATPVRRSTHRGGALSTAGSHKTTGYMRKVATLGIQVADALQHAHDCGVIHRDIKPSNLLLDNAGKVWVTDFGLARIQSETSITMSGDVLGTARYMSPEQAAGRSGWVDHRSDVYSLGITLYELLTLHDVFEGADHQEFLRRIEHEEPRSPRRLNPAIPVDLETIVLKAISKPPQQRYTSAQELADDLRRYLDGKPTLARRPTVMDRVGKWSVRHRKAVLAASLVLLVSLIGLSVAMLIIANLQAKTQDAKEVAQTHFRQARGVVDRFGTGLANDLASLPGSERLRKQILLEVLEYHEQFVAQAGDDPTLRSDLARSHFRIGKITENTGDTEESLAAYEQALQVYSQLIRQQPPIDRHRADSALCYNNIGLLHLRRGDINKSRRALRSALRIQKELVVRHPDNPTYRFELALTYGNFALLCAKTEALPDAIAAFDESIRHKADLAHRFPSRPEFLSSLAVTLLNQSGILSLADPTRARQCCEQAITIHRQLADSHPDQVGHHRDLSLGYNRLGALQRRERRWDQAEQSYRWAIEIGQRLVLHAPANTDFRSELAGSRNNLGQTLLDLDRPQEALAQFEAARDLIGELRRIDSQDVRYASGLGGVFNNLGTALQTIGRLDEAIQAYKRAVEIQRAAVRASPDVTRFREFLDNHLLNYSEALRQADRPQDAAIAVRERAGLWDRNVEKLPPSVPDKEHDVP